MSIRRRLMAALVAGGLLAGAIGAPAVAVVATTFTIYVGSGCVYFQGVASTSHTVTILDGTEVLASTTAPSDSGGYGCACSDTDVVPGLRVRIQKTGYSRTITVPALAVKTDRSADVISGAAPAGKAVSVTVYRYTTGTYGTGPTITKTPTATASGTFSVDVTVDGGFRGGDIVGVVYTNASTGDVFRVDTYAEYMRIDRGAPKVFAVLNPGSTELELQTGAGAVRGRAYLSPEGVGGGSNGAFRTGAGTLIYPRAGEKVVGDFAPDATMTIPLISIAAAAATDVVTLTCPGMAGQGAYIYVRKADYTDSAYRYGTTNASGVRTFDVTADIDLTAGDNLYGRCRFDSGDEIGRHGSVAP
jgi:hypothetical protein